MLLPSSIGAAVVFAVLVRDGLRRWREAPSGPLRHRVATASLLCLVGLPNVLLAAPMLVGKVLLWKRIAALTRDEIAALASGIQPARQ